MNWKRHLLSPKWSHIDCRFEFLFLPFFCCLQIFPYHVQTKRFFFIIQTQGLLLYFCSKKKLFFFIHSNHFEKRRTKKITILNDISEAFRAKTSHTQIWLFFFPYLFWTFQFRKPIWMGTTHKSKIRMR